jgi:pimeloyl-ACP methyl ester carboxylesterase
MRSSAAARLGASLTGVLLVFAFALVCAAAASAQSAREAATLHLGSQTLKRCETSPLAYCGRLAVPLDYSNAGSPDISIAYRWYPASAPADGRPSGTVVPVEGGPGYPSIGSVSYPSGSSAAGYSAMYGPLLRRWNMLAVDNRGTGESTLLDCPALQTFSGPTGTEAFQQAAAGCAAGLNHRWKYANGEWVHASDLFTSAPAAEDLASVIKALDVGRVDLYGDSYGSFFAQVFASRFPSLLRSVTLDSTYETVGLDPWYRSTVAAMPADFDVACSRSPACAQAASGPSWSRIVALAGRLRAGSVSGVVPGATGAMESVSVNVIGLVDLLNDAAGDPRIYRELDASARALLDAGDAAPLLRLYAQRLYEDEDYFTAPASEYSDELYLAVSCLDYPQLFQMSASPAARAAQLTAAEAALPASTFSPFSIGEWLQQDQNTEAFTACLDWPSPTVAQPPVLTKPPLLESSLPVLVLGGELDTWTPPAGAPAVLAQIGGHARFIELANSTHVVGEGDTECGGSVIQRFVEDPAAIDSLNTSCAPAIPPIRAVGVYAAALSEEQPLHGSPGGTTSAADLRLAAAAVSTAGDAIARFQAIEARLDHGLEGGTVHASEGGLLLKLRRDRLVPGVSISGTVELTPDTNAAEGYAVRATLSAKAPGVRRASFQATWTTAGAGAQAQVTGAVEGQRVAGTMPAP